MADAAEAAIETPEPTEPTEAEQAEARGDNFDPEAGKSAPEPEGAQESPAADAGGDGEGTADADAGGDGEGAEETPEKPSGIMLPQTRYNAMRDRLNNENEELRRELEELRNQPAQQQQPVQQQQPQQNSLDEQLKAVDAEYAKAIADGEHEKAAQYMQYARGLERQAFNEAIQQASTQTTTASQQSMEYNIMVDQVEVAHPELNANSDTFDEALSNEVVDLVEAFTSTGATARNALERALGYVFPEGWNTQPAAPAAAPKSTDVGKNIKAAKAQAPEMGRGENSDTAGKQAPLADPMSLSDAEFDKLTEKELAAMRGDDF